MEQQMQSTASGQTERQWAAGVHVASMVLAMLTSWSAGVAGAVASIGIWFLVRDRYPFAAEHAKEAFNFNLSMFLYAVVLVVVTIFTLGLGLVVVLPLALILGLVWLICSIIAALRAWDGQHYRYPLTIRLWK